MWKKFLVALLLVSFMGCSTNEKLEHKKIARLNIEADPKTLDPRKVRELNSVNLCKSLFEGLFRLNTKGEIEKALVEDMEISQDNKTYTFHLKPSFWSNGDPLTSADFAYGWKKTLSPDFPSPFAYQLFIIKGAKEGKEGTKTLSEIAISTPDPLTLVVELNQPSPYFLDMLTMPIFFPINERWEKKCPTCFDSNNTFVSNGPFILEKWLHNDKIILKKNEKYWDSAKVNLAKLSFIMVSPDIELSLYEKNELDWIGSPFSTLPLAAMETLKTRNDFYSFPYLGTAFLRVNVQKVNYATRCFLSTHIDRKAITEHVLRGGQKPAFSLVPLSKLSITNIEAPNHLPFNQSLTLSYVHSDRNRLIAEAIQNQLEATGNCKVKLESIEFKTLLDRITQGNYQLALGNWIADFSDPMNFLEPFKFKNNGTNNTFWESKKYISLLDKASVMIDPIKRNHLLEKAEGTLLQDLPLIPIYHLSLCYLKRESLKNVVISNTGIIDFKWSDM